VILLDTSATITFAEGDAAMVSVLGRYSTRPIASYVTIGELRAGIEMATSPAVRLARQGIARAIADRFAVHRLDDRDLDSFAAARRVGLRGNDAWVVASAFTLGATLVTRDERQAALAGELMTPGKVVLVPPGLAGPVAGV
jgi:predicted nucleic acid-binding protein